MFNESSFEKSNQPTPEEKDSPEYSEDIENGVWKPDIFKEYEDRLGVGASTKKLKELIGRPEGGVRITADQERFDQKFSEESSETREKKLAAGRILIGLLREVAPQADPHDIEKSGLEHGDDILVVDEEYLEKDKKERARSLADGMITDLKDKPLMVPAADCAPVGVYDPENEAIGTFHSGWRGTLKQIAPQGVEKMVETYGSDLKELKIAVGPHADGERFEVGQEVYDKFVKAKDEQGEALYSSEDIEEMFTKNPDNPGHYYFDSGKAIKISLERVGVPEENIQVSDHSTMSEEGNQLFSSERIEGHEARDSFVFMMNLKEAQEE